MHKLSINGKHEGITRGDLLEVARNMEIKKGDRIISEVEGAVARWPEFAAEAKVSPKVIQYIGGCHLVGPGLDQE